MGKFGQISIPVVEVYIATVWNEPLQSLHCTILSLCVTLVDYDDFLCCGGLVAITGTDFTSSVM